MYVHKSLQYTIQYTILVSAIMYIYIYTCVGQCKTYFKGAIETFFAHTDTYLSIYKYIYIYIYELSSLVLKAGSKTTFYMYI